MTSASKRGQAMGPATKADLVEAAKQTPDRDCGFKTTLEVGLLLRGTTRQGLRSLDHLFKGTLTFQEEKSFLDSVFLITFKGPAKEAQKLVDWIEELSRD